MTTINFSFINGHALNALPTLLGRWLPDGKMQGREYVALNPMRHDTKHGSFKVNTRTGQWADFASGDRGGDVISLAAYLSNSTQKDAALSIAAMLGVDHG